MTDRRAALGACLGAGFATLLDQAVVPYTVPGLAAELHAPAGAVQWFLAVYSLTFGMGLVPGGRLGDSFGRRGLFLAGLALFFAGATTAVLGPAIGVVIAARAVQGFGAGIISAQVLGVIQDLFDGRDRVRAFAAYGAAASASAVVGPLVAAGILALAPPATAWRLVLTVSLPFVVATGLVALRSLPTVDPSTRRAPRLDVPGMALTALVVVLVTVPVVDPGIGAGAVLGVVAAAVVVVVALVAWERRARHPVFAPGLVRSKGFVSGNVVAALWFGAGIAQASVVTLFLLQGFGLSPVSVALVLVPGAVARIAGSWSSTHLYQRFGTRLLPVCLAVQALSIAVLAVVVGGRDDVALFVAVLAVELVVGVASGVFEPAIRHTTLRYALLGEYGVAASFLQLTQRLAATFCVALVTGVSFAGSTGAHMDADGILGALVVCTALLTGALAAAMALDASERRSARQGRGDDRLVLRAGAEAPGKTGSPRRYPGDDDSP